ncbi:MAG: 5'/3'-nucleotidase SurE [Planctomycetes bacterium RBG_13_60_9]|nr:MAG: 5'/3'-nucleotidase SurE [Planctomycetes bacterium RBG_13_60_9]
MKILLTNDDGIFAPGLAAVFKRLVTLGDVTVVAPMDVRSGTSHSVTFFEPLACCKVDVNGQFSGFGVRGSPADCVKLACMQLHDGPIDLVVSGINHGANAGINVYYSGTVAAAMEAAFLRIPSVALSVMSEPQMDFERAADYSVAVLKKLLPLHSGDVINVNLPLLSRGEPRGVRVVPQATAGFHESYVPQDNGGGEMLFQLAYGDHREEQIATDTTSLAEGYITVTALLPDMTDHGKTLALKTRFNGELP